MPAHALETLRTEAVRLRIDERKTNAEIRALLKISEATATRWLRAYPLTPEEERARRKAKRLAEIERQRAPDGGLKTCPGCGDKKPPTAEFFGSRGRKNPGIGSSCRECHKADSKRRWLNIKVEVMTHYSDGPPYCACCGESTIEFLSIDHINGGGNRDRLAGRNNLAGWLRKHGYPSGFRVLCFNCNCARGFFGYCPHERDRARAQERAEAC